MNALVIVILVGALAAALGLTAAGFRPAPRLAEFCPDRTATPRVFVDTADHVHAAYLAAAARTPGMVIAEQGPRLLYLDSRPTARVLAGDFGVALLVRFADQTTGGTVVTVDAQAKMWAPTRAATLTELERALRMRAKTTGITELIHHRPKDSGGAQPATRHTN